jgi:hypothetical protein
MGGRELDLSGSGQGHVTGSFRESNKLSGSIKCGRIFLQAYELLVSQDRLCSTVLVA